MDMLEERELRAPLGARCQAETDCRLAVLPAGGGAPYHVPLGGVHGVEAQDLLRTLAAAQQTVGTRVEVDRLVEEHGAVAVGYIPAEVRPLGLGLIPPPSALALAFALSPSRSL